MNTTTTITTATRTGGPARIVTHKPYGNATLPKPYRDAVSPPPNTVRKAVAAHEVVDLRVKTSQKAPSTQVVVNKAANKIHNAAPSRKSKAKLTITKQVSAAAGDRGHKMVAIPHQFVAAPQQAAPTPSTRVHIPSAAQSAANKAPKAIANIAPPPKTAKKSWPTGQLPILDSAQPAIDQSTAIGWEVSQEEWDRRKAMNHCQWCNSTEHNRCNHCVWWWLDHKDQQIAAIGRDVRAVERRRRGKCHVCVWCASPKHQQKDCLKAARAQAQEAMDKLGDSWKTQAEAKAARKAAWEEKQKAEVEEKEKGGDVQEEQKQKLQPVRKPNFRGRRR